MGATLYVPVATTLRKEVMWRLFVGLFPLKIYKLILLKT